MKQGVLGLVVGVVVATAGLALAQNLRQGNEPLDVSVGTRDWQVFWQREALEDLRVENHLRALDPCGR